MPVKTPRGGIERKILRSILWVGILPVAFALIVGYLGVRFGQGRAVEQTLATATQKTVTGLRLAANSRLRTIASLAADPDVIAALAPADNADETAVSSVGRTLEALQARLQGVAKSAEDGQSTFALYNAQGRLILGTDRVDAQLNDPAWVEALTYKGYFQFSCRAEGERYEVRVAAPVRAPGTDVVVGHVVEISRVDSLLRYALGFGADEMRKHAPGDVYQMVFAGPGVGGMVTTYLDTRAPANIPALVSESTFPGLVTAFRDPRTAANGTLRFFNYETRGRSFDAFLAYERLFPGEDVYLVVYRPASIVFTSINRGALLAVAFCLFLIACLCVNAYRNVHNNIVRHILLVNEGAQIIRQGDLDLKLIIDTGDEIEELASSFNKMALALSRNIKQLEESEEKYRSLVTSMRDGICQTDAEGVVTFLNQAGLDCFGFAKTSEVIGKTLKEFFLEEIDFARITSELKANGFIERSRVWMKRQDGRTICVELSGNQVYDDDGRFVGTEAIFRDVTKSVHLEQEARERSERISAINQIANVINSSLEAGRLYESLVAEIKTLVAFDYAALALLDESTGGFGARQLWPEHEVYPGYTYHLDSSASCAAWVAQENKCLVVDDLRKNDSPYADQFPEQTRSCICVPLYATGRIIGTLNLGANLPRALSKHDVEVLEQVAPHVAVAIRNAQLLENLQVSLEEVTRAREELHKANEELKTLDEMKTNLLSNVSHELRTPLVSVMGYTDMILNEKAGPISDVQKEYLGISLRNTEKLVTLIENLLDFSRLHRGAEKLVFDTFDLVDCAKSGMQIVQPVADSRQIDLRLIAPPEPVLVDGDRGKMGQIFINLLSNAVKFNHNEGTVTVEIKRNENAVDVGVTDTGIGIPPEALDKIFTRFYQYDSSSTRKYGGTGIGLSIAQDIARLHGSRITVSSEVGQGSVFRFSLQTRPVVAEPSSEVVELPLPTETHLLVELLTQDRALSGQVRQLLVSEGMDVIHATNTDNAVVLAQKYRPDCVIVDMEATGDVPEVLDDLFAASAAGVLPAIMITNDDDLYERLQRRVAARVKRDFRKSSLLSGISRALNQGAEVPGALGGKILCVDDDPEVLAFMTRCLEAEGYEADCCASGETCLERVRTLEYGLVLLDIAMPGMDGWETCRRIKTNPTLAGIKVYMVTAKPVDQALARAKDTAIDGYLLKPFRAEDLADVIQNLGLFHATKEV